MKLKRFKTDNFHLDYMNRENKEKKTTNESKEYSKLELLAHISKNWNDDLNKEFESIRSLYSKTKKELMSINDKYIKITENNDTPKSEESKTEEKSESQEESTNQKKSESQEESKNEQLIIDTVAELTMKYGNNDAVESIRIDEGKIVFDLLCDTDIEQSVTEYNGIKLHYNKICSIKENSLAESLFSKNEDEDEIINEKILISQSLFMSETYSSKEITLDDLKYSKWFKYLKTTDYSTDFTIKFLYDVRNIGLSINDAIFFLMHIFKKYKNEPTSEEYKKELDDFLSQFK